MQEYTIMGSNEELQYLSNGKSKTATSDLAPWLSVPPRAVSVVEHPCIIKNLDKGIQSLGGAINISKALRCKPIPEYQRDDTLPDLQLPEFISVSLRPDDPYAKRMLSAAVTTNNILLKVTVPKRTGRKRKRGTNGPFLYEEETSKSSTDNDMAKPANSYADASTAFRCVEDNASAYSVTPVGIVDEAHRFRGLPDIQIASSEDTIARAVAEKLLPLHYNDMKDFNVNIEPGVDLTKGVAMSAEYMQMPITYSYRFQQNPYVKYVNDRREEINLQKRLTVDGYHIVEPTVEQVPTRPKSHLPPEHTLNPYMRTMIMCIRAELARRPIITRHLLYNTLGWDKRQLIREAAVYCGYFFASGAWREALVVWGLDPRTKPEYRKYQTVSFLSFNREGTTLSRIGATQHYKNLAKATPLQLATQHTFDGVHVSETGQLFQICDITDPLIKGILNTKNLRQTCAPTFPGWYHIGTWAKATVILKDKMNRLLAHQGVDNSLYTRILTWPEIWVDKEIAETYWSEMNDKEIHEEKRQEHTLMYTVRLAARNPKWAFELMEERDRREKEGTAAPESDKIPQGVEDEVPEDLTEAPDTADTIFLEVDPNEGNEDGENADDFDDDEEDDRENIEESFDPDNDFGDDDDDDDDDDDNMDDGNEEDPDEDLGIDDESEEDPDINKERWFFTGHGPRGPWDWIDETDDMSE